jgi:hypothetical protein
MVRISSHWFSKLGSAPGGSASGSDKFSSLGNLDKDNSEHVQVIRPQCRFLGFQFLTDDEKVMLIDEYLYY